MTLKNTTSNLTAKQIKDRWNVDVTTTLAAQVFKVSNTVTITVNFSRVCGAYQVIECITEQDLTQITPEQQRDMIAILRNEDAFLLEDFEVMEAAQHYNFAKCLMDEFGFDEAAVRTLLEDAGH